MYFKKLKWSCLLKYANYNLKSVFSRNNSCECDHFVKGKVAVITGGADGIGLECAKELLKNGVRGLVIGDLHREKECMEILKKDYCRIIFKKCNVTNKAELAGLFQLAIDRWNCLHIVLNNAGILNDAEWEREIETNVTACVRGTYLGLQYMSKNKNGCGGAIVNFSSTMGMDYFGPSPVYVGTKHFVIGFSRSIGEWYHYKRTGVRLLTICPGVTLTSMICNAEKFANEELDCKIGEVLCKELATLPSQGPTAVAKGVMEMLNTGETGNTWVVECNEFYRILFPDRDTLRPCNFCHCCH